MATKSNGRPRIELGNGRAPDGYSRVTYTELTNPENRDLRREIHEKCGEKVVHVEQGDTTLSILVWPNRVKAYYRHGPDEGVARTLYILRDG